MSSVKEAYLWDKAAKNNAQCNLCNFRCLITPGKTGRCGVRKNIGGTLCSRNYNMLCAAGVDPIEKKPLYHFLPGSSAYSIAAPGCNFRCVFCQNWQISQWQCSEMARCRKVNSEGIVKAAIDDGCKSIAYTYSEPTVFIETATDAAVVAKKAGLKNIFVSNGFMTCEAIDFAKNWLDAINVDLKAFTQSFYKEMTGADLEPVLNTLRHIKANTNIHMEITTLLIPDSNDSTRELSDMARFIADEISTDTPWHVSAFYPAYKLDHKSATSPDLVLKACDIGRSAGLKYVYAGNIGAANNTHCPDCGELVIERNGYRVKIYNNTAKCVKCGSLLPLIYG